MITSLPSQQLTRVSLIVKKTRDKSTGGPAGQSVAGKADSTSGEEAGQKQTRKDGCLIVGDLPTLLGIVRRVAEVTGRSSQPNKV